MIWLNYSLGSGILFRDGALGLLAALFFLPVNNNEWWNTLSQHIQVSQHLLEKRPSGSFFIFFFYKWFNKCMVLAHWRPTEITRHDLAPSPLVFRPPCSHFPPLRAGWGPQLGQGHEESHTAPSTCWLHVSVHVCMWVCVYMSEYVVSCNQTF